MRRYRLLLYLSVALAACSPGARTASPPGLSPSATLVAPREQTADQQIRHALARLTFGARPGDEQAVRAMGVDNWIARQLQPERIDDRATERFITSHFPTVTLSSSELARTYPPRGEPGAVRRIVGELQAARVARAVMSERQLQEVMVDFWLNHFNVFVGKGPERYLLAAYEREAIRPYALGKFRDLLGAVARSPAMLFYLDNWRSRREAGSGKREGVDAWRMERRLPPPRPTPAGPPLPAARRSPRASRFPRPGLNENYGRELLELHTLGVDGGYTQQDVIAAARAFTGWTIARPRQGGDFVFRPAWHDTGEKRFLGHTLPAGRGIEDGEEVLDILARHPSTAHFIATKLVRRFVSDSPPPALVERAAATFSRTDGDIRETMRTILTSPEFFSRTAYRAKVKTPFELVVSALRAVGAAPDSTPRTARVIARLGQPLYGHRDPNGYPETGEAWINTGAVLDRINFGLALAAGRVPGVSLTRWAHAQHLDQLPHDQQVDAVIRELLGGEAPPETREMMERPERSPSVPHLVALAVGSPEFQKR